MTQRNKLIRAIAYLKFFRLGLEDILERDSVSELSLPHVKDVLHLELSDYISLRESELWRLENDKKETEANDFEHDTGDETRIVSDERGGKNNLRGLQKILARIQGR